MNSFFIFRLFFFSSFFFDKTIKYTFSTYFEIIFIEEKKMMMGKNSPYLYLFIKNIYILGSSWGFFCPKNKKQTIFTFNKKIGWGEDVCIQSKYM